MIRKIAGLVVILVVFAIFGYRLAFRGHPISGSGFGLKVAYSFFQSSSSLDTAKINTVYEYELIHNIYSRLVEFNADNQLVPGVAEAFSFNNGEIEFSFGNKVTTPDGHVIDALDAAMSLKRLVLAGKTGHGDIRRLLCPGQVLTSIHDDCPGIRVAGNKLILRPARAYFVPLLVSVLESADYSIVPQSSFDLTQKNIPIKDYRNTSGPYYVEKDSSTGAFTLRANPRHYHFNPAMPQTVELVPTELSEGPTKLIAGEVDLITTAEYFSGADAETILKDSTKYNIHATLPFRVDMVCFTPSAVKKYSVAHRLYAARKFAEAKDNLWPVYGSQPTHQFFQALSDGSLSAEQEASLEHLVNQDRRPSFKEPIGLAILKSGFDKFSQALAGVSEINITHAQKSAYTLPVNLRPDMYSVSTDSAWTENLSLLGHNFEMGIFHLAGLDPDKWFVAYLETPDKEARIRILNKLHFELLSKAVIYPFASYPYYAVANKSWSLNYSQLSSDTDLWRMRRN